MKLVIPFLVGALTFAGPALADSPAAEVSRATEAATLRPGAGGFIAGAQVYPFSDSSIFEGYVAPGQVTDLALQPGEALVAVASGDTARWAIGDTTSGTGVTRQVHVLIKPFTAGLRTNLVVTTDRRTYHLQLLSTQGTAMSSIRWTYPHDELVLQKQAARAEAAAAPVASGIRLEKLHFSYDITGDNPDWKPLRAFDDGQHTYIQFPLTLAQGEAPPLFVISNEGQAELVNYRLQGRYYVVDRLFDLAELRLGLKKQQIVRIVRHASGKGRTG
ncbi:P-type conjugative transfer protein TrbG [Novosphingobium decolorationis]|uniref:P-type conjugative transfer protein TrbG n=1 Tax=Novosphingobium decolorationis TaxID=2698673 RepID=A0ABX8E9L9_9SPHN|nr:P-type conjugative transfer protein TrbG [Novosphingobium decolorationis]QVM85279.1 P-type conjugative transfer protein TrbG [Novosphingobium decolorationis]